MITELKFVRDVWKKMLTQFGDRIGSIEIEAPLTVSALS